MKKICITDMTLRRAAENRLLGFKERVELAKLLDKLNISALELPTLSGSKADSIFVKTLCSVITNTTLAQPAGLTAEEADAAWKALERARRPRLVIDAPISSVQMEYIARKKPPQMLAAIEAQVKHCAALCKDVEVSFQDATRAETEFLCEAIRIAIANGASAITLCDTAGVLLPDEFAAFLTGLYEQVPEMKDAFIKVACNDTMELAGACAVKAFAMGAQGVKCCFIGNQAPKLSTICHILKMRGESLGLYTSARITELERTVGRILNLLGAEAPEAPGAAANSDEGVTYDAGDSLTAIADAVRKLGYELTDDDMVRVYEEFLTLAAKRSVTAKELDAIVAASAMQVPAAYQLQSFVINSGNIITSTASVRLEKDGATIEGISFGDGPIDAAFKAIEQVTNRHYELEDFRIDAVTEGKEAIGRAIVKLRYDGRLYSGSGVSTDIIGAAIRAYLGAMNKIVYEEKEA
jgi:2-isopropylmalate synthase